MFQEISGSKAETRRTKMNNKTRQNNKGADRKIESNDSPEIPDRGETSEEPGLHLSLVQMKG